MKETPSGTSVGVDDPYDHAGRCDRLTDDGRCRFAFERFEADPGFAADRRDDGYHCPVAAAEADEEPSVPDWRSIEGPAPDLAWRDCPHYRSITDGQACARCGLGERLVAHDDDRPLLEEHHLAYPEEGAGHEITVALCRWCHAKIHNSWARLGDDARPEPEAIAAMEGRRDRELDELSFRTAADRRDD